MASVKRMKIELMGFSPHHHAGRHNLYDHVEPSLCHGGSSLGAPERNGHLCYGNIDKIIQHQRAKIFLISITSAPIRPCTVCIQATPLNELISLDVLGLETRFYRVLRQRRILKIYT